jgi:hypothetical protein
LVYAIVFLASSGKRLPGRFTFGRWGYLSNPSEENNTPSPLLPHPCVNRRNITIGKKNVAACDHYTHRKGVGEKIPM